LKAKFLLGLAKSTFKEAREHLWVRPQGMASPDWAACFGYDFCLILNLLLLKIVSNTGLPNQES